MFRLITVFINVIITTQSPFKGDNAANNAFNIIEMTREYNVDCSEVVSNVIKCGRQEAMIVIHNGIKDRIHKGFYRDPIIRRTLPKGSTTWRLNNKMTNKGDLDVVGLNIKVNNLCQCLAEDRVFDFAKAIEDNQSYRQNKDLIRSSNKNIDVLKPEIVALRTINQSHKNEKRQLERLAQSFNHGRPLGNAIDNYVAQADQHMIHAQLNYDIGSPNYGKTMQHTIIVPSTHNAGFHSLKKNVH